MSNIIGSKRLPAYSGLSDVAMTDYTSKPFIERYALLGNQSL
jgi:hypothetical protein